MQSLQTTRDLSDAAGSMTGESTMAVAAANLFIELFGVPTDLWVSVDRRWHHPKLADGSTEPKSLEDATTVQPTWLPLNPEQADEPSVDELAPGLYCVQTKLPVPAANSADGSSTAVAVGTVRTSVPELMKSLLKISERNGQLKREVVELERSFAPHLEQISANFEELSFLRHLSHLASTSDITDPHSLAKQITDDMCDLVKASGTVFVIARQLNSQADPNAAEVDEPLFSSGQIPLNSTQISALVNVLHRRSQMLGPVVCNRMNDQAEFEAFPGLKSSILVPVTHQGRLYGWLLAVNRIPWNQRSFGPRELASVTLNDDDFGTNEAGLMSTATVSLAAQFHAAELFQDKEVLLVGIVRALINAIDAKDSYTCGHSDRVAVIARHIAEQMQLGDEKCEQVYLSGLLHDIGKIGIPDQVLMKPGKLTEEEFAVIRMHPEIGHRILNHLPELRNILPGVLHHHESVNGQGYPMGLQGDSIPLFARILAVADSYDAMTSARPYRSAMGHEKAVGILNNGAGTQWDKIVVDAFLAASPSIAATINSSCEQHDVLLNPNRDDVPAWHTHESDAVAFAVASFAKP